MSITIALVGNPNSGKTTMFNDLTGSSQYVGNWPGVTVEKKEGKLKGHQDVLVIDLPGIYSLSPYTLEEVVSRDFLLNEQPDAIINIIDASNLERNLYLTMQLAEIGVPMVLALNMIDIVHKNGDHIDVAGLGQTLGCDIVETSALKGGGSRAAAEKALTLALFKTQTTPSYRFSDTVEQTLSKISKRLKDVVDERLLRWCAIKVFERDVKVLAQLPLSTDDKAVLEAATVACEAALDDDSESIIANERYMFIAKMTRQHLTKKNTSRMTASDNIDLIVTNRFLALPIFAAVMFFIYFLSITSIGGWASGWVGETLFGEIIPNAVESFLVSVNCADWLMSLILDGIIAGVGAVLGFLPQMCILFLCLGILEDCGYMTRIAFIMDCIFRKFGLSGKSFIPFLIGTGCSVPGIMATRTIENEHDRRMTILTTSFIPCSAKLPIIALIAGALFPSASWVGPSAYFVGIAAVICSGRILKKTPLFAGEASPFIMELPAYHMPGIRNVLLQTWDRVKSFVKKAGTIIFLACALLWFLSSFNWSLKMVNTADSMLASLGARIAPLFKPLGWGSWQAAVATLTGLVAKENVVGTFGILYAAQGAEATTGMTVWANLQAAFTPLSAYSLLLFNLLCAPCCAAIGAIRREMGSAKWTVIAVGYQCLLAYAVSLVVYQLGMLFTGHSFNMYTAAAILLLLLFLYLLFRPENRHKPTAGYVREVLEC